MTVEMMLDPITLGIALATVAIAFTVYFLFFHSGGDDFDKAYPADARRLLISNEKDKKAPAKVNKKKTKKDGKYAQKEETAEQPEPIEAKPKVEEKIASKQTIPTKKTEDEAGPSRNAENAQQQIQSADAVEETEKKAVQPTENVAPKKAAKKAVKPEKLDAGKVVSALSKIPEIDEAYITFLQTFVSNSTQNSQKADKLTREIERYNLEKLDIKEKLTTAVRAKDMAEVSVANSAKLIDELRHKYQTLTTENAESKVKINHLQQKANQEQKNISDGVNAAAAEAVRWRAEFNKAKEIGDSVTAERNSLHQLVQDMEKKNIFEQQQFQAQESFSQQKIAELTLACQNVSDHFSGYEESFAALKTENAELKEELSTKQKEFEERLQSQRKEADARLEEREAAHEVEKNKAMEAYKSMQELVESLNSEVARFEQYKLELEQRERALLNQQQTPEDSAIVAKLQEENQVLKEKNSSIEKEKASLEKTVGELKQGIEYQKEKNNELRARNFAIVEHSKESCKSDKSVDSTSAKRKDRVEVDNSRKECPGNFDKAAVSHILGLLKSSLNEIDKSDAAGAQKQKSSSQICEIRESLTNISGQPAVSNPSVKSDESDWELVN